MKKSHLAKLARLASGAAVVTAGAACTPSNVTTAPTGDGSNPPHTVNAPATPTSDNPTGAGDLADAGITVKPGVNAPPFAAPNVDDDGGAAATDGGAGGVRRLPRGVNAVPPGGPNP